jgi:hypothetical protein
MNFFIATELHKFLSVGKSVGVETVKFSGTLILTSPCRSSSGYSLASHRGGPGLRPGSMWGLWWTKRHWGRFSPSTSVSPANHFTNFSIIIITIGHWWPQCRVDLGFHPPLYHLKKIDINKNL